MIILICWSEAFLLQNKTSQCNQQKSKLIEVTQDVEEVSLAQMWHIYQFKNNPSGSDS